MFGPLSFPSVKEESYNFVLSDANIKSSSCLLCEEEFVLFKQRNLFLQHLLFKHNLVIRDVIKIACLNAYVEYWKIRLKSVKLQEICVQSITSDSFDDLPSLNIGDFDIIDFNNLARNKIFVLSDDIPEDKELRNNLQTKRLDLVLEQQRKEREINNYCRECLFCHTEISGTTTDYLNHLSGKHNLLLGKPQNLVFVDQLINTIESKLENLKCLYCEKIFKDRNVLKEHMRKKLHKRINPKNTEYDRFYIVNYLEMGKNWKSFERIKENDSPDSDGSDSDWSDWREEIQIQIVCLFCKNNSFTWEDTLDHMKLEHNFDYKKYSCEMDFYQQVKLVNYVRRQIHRSSCISCDFISNSGIEDLLNHMKNENHFILPDQSLWDQPE
ncbi:zinc finger protein 277 isoform X2 [Lycorma delicatula]